VHEERLNGVLRDRLNYLTRKTHAFAKDGRTWDAAVTLSVFEHNCLASPSCLAGAGGRPAQRALVSPANPSDGDGIDRPLDTTSK